MRTRLAAATAALLVGAGLLAGCTGGPPADTPVTEFNPDIKALAVGETGALMTNDDGGIPGLEFVITVTE